MGESEDTCCLPYTLEGEVICGKRLGRELGFPTANQVFEPCADTVPLGIYVAVAEIDGIRYPAVSNVGTRPTVNGDGVNCESHIIGFSGDIYGKRIKTTLLRRIREEMRFSSLEELRLQIQKDVSCAAAFFKDCSADIGKK